MKIDSKLIPSHILRLMNPEDKPLGVAGYSPQECQEVACKKLERDHHIVFSQWLNLNALPFIHSRTDRKTTSEKGIPDYVVLLRGKAICIEFKVGGNKLSKDQEDYILKLSDTGTDTHIVSMAAEAIEIINKHLKNHRSHTEPFTNI